ncbi:MAG: thymidine phosphorylase [Bacilli bacterium]
MNILNIIDKKRKNQALTFEEIQYFVNGYVDGKIKDYQISSLLMAICINGMTDNEVIDFTKVIIESGDILDLSDINDVVCDKHSTGGVGDKTTLMILPLASSCGLKIAKMSGRGLGHTGGTIDKLESIPGFNVNMDLKTMVNQIKDINVALTSQTGNITPADKKLYALRDVTGTTSSIPLIAASIMSKKIASSSDVILLDVKCGKGALLTTIEDAKKLARLMIKIGHSFKRKVTCFLTNMNHPLGKNIGNSLEVLEVYNLLENKKINDVSTLSINIVAGLLSMSRDLDFNDSLKIVEKKYNSNEVLDRFIEFIEKQGGNISNLPINKNPIYVKSKKEGFIKEIDALKLGEFARSCGAGRLTKEETIDYSAGLVLHKTINDKVSVNDILLEVHTNKEVDLDKIYDAYEFSEEKVEVKLILDIIKEY